MAGQAADRSPSSPNTSESDWLDAARHRWRRYVLLLAHWRLRIGVGLGLVAHALRRAWRYSLRRDPPGEEVARVGGSDGPLLPSVASVRPLPAPADRRDPSAPTDDHGTTDSLPATGEPRRELPAGDGVLDVERTPDRLIMSDPAEDAAYIASTHWVDVEE